MEKNTINKKYNLMMEVLTPLHVGAGSEKDWIFGSDFIVDDGKIKILNLDDVAKYVNIEDLTAALLQKDADLLKNKLGSNLDKTVERTFPANYIGSNDIKTFIKNGLSNRPIVPGSSLKGAIRSIVIHHLLDGSTTLDEKDLMGQADKGDEFMRFIKIADAEFESTGLVNTKIFNLQLGFKGGWKHGRYQTNNTFKPDGFNTICEVINPKEQSFLSISISDKAFDNFYKNSGKPRKKTEIIENDISFLFNIINNHTRAYLRKEKAFFQKYQADKTDKIIDSIENILKQIPSNGEYCVLKMSAGSGFHSITGDWKFDDYSIDEVDTSGRVSRGKLKGEKSTKSRKIAILNNGHLSLMGFVKLTKLSDDEIKRIEEEKLLQQIELERKQKERALQLAEQKQIELEKQQEFERKRKEFEKLILEAEKSYADNNLDLALTTLKEAILLFPEDSECKNKIEEIEIQIEKEEKDREFQRQVEQQAAEAAALRQEQIEGGLSFLEEKFDDGRYKVTDSKGINNRVNQWLKKANTTLLPKEEYEFLYNSLKRIYEKANNREKKNWGDFNKGIWNSVKYWINEDDAKEWFDEIIKS